MPKSSRNLEAAKNCVRVGRSGATLIEVLLTTVLVSAIVMGLALFASKASSSFVRARTRNFASATASSVMQTVKTKPYPLVALTQPGNYFPLSSNCDCNSVDFSQLPAGQVISNGKGTFTQTTCTNLVTPAPGGGWQSYCPGSQADSGLKNIVVNMTWDLNGTTQTYTLGSMVTQNKQFQLSAGPLSSVIVSICQQDPTQGFGPSGFFTSSQVFGPSNGCTSTGSSEPTLANSEVAVYKIGGVLADGQGTVVNLSVPVDINYSVQVQKQGYFPFHLDGVGLTAGTTTYVYAYMRKISDFGSTVAGETYVADHPVITKVVAQVADVAPSSTCAAPGPSCQDQTEVLELYNPTTSTYTFGTGGNIQLVYCTNSACGFYTLGEIGQFTKNTTFSFFPGSYYLIEGLDPSVPHNPPNWALPDITYTASAMGPGGLIPYTTGGGIQIQVNNGGTWTTVDTVSWNGQDGSGPAPAVAPVGPWKGSPIAWPGIQPILCTP